jgi:uncharacterized protein YbjT (DUF2867 family)
VQGDLSTGAGLIKALDGMEAIVHAASATTEPTKFQTTDVLGTRRLLAMAREEGVKHVLYISIVGIDGVSYPYYTLKRKAEAVVQENIVPWSILRATQFHTLMELFLGTLTRLPFIAPIPFKLQFQPVDHREVAVRVVEAVLQIPAGRLPDFGGPEVRDFRSLAASWLAALKMDRRMFNLPLPFKFSRQIAEGRLLCPDHMDGKVTFEQYLAEKYAG